LLATPALAQQAAAPEAEEPDSIVALARAQLGRRYLLGGNEPDRGFDCSGFTRYIFEQSLGLALPRRADEQASAPGFAAVGRDDLQPGASCSSTR
jgi:cell wall-associated NlpC family hydrolase